jgi:hypothetical protein
MSTYLEIWELYLDLQWLVWERQQMAKLVREAVSFTLIPHKHRKRGKKYQRICSTLLVGEESRGLRREVQEDRER